MSLNSILLEINLPRLQRSLEKHGPIKAQTTSLKLKQLTKFRWTYINIDIIVSAGSSENHALQLKCLITALYSNFQCKFWSNQYKKIQPDGFHQNILIKNELNRKIPTTTNAGEVIQSNDRVMVY